MLVHIVVHIVVRIIAHVVVHAVVLAVGTSGGSTERAPKLDCSGGRGVGAALGVVLGAWCVGLYSRCWRFNGGGPSLRLGCGGC